MKKQNSFAGYILIGIGAYFLLKQLKIPIFTDFYSWPTLLIIIGLALLIHSYKSRDYHNLFSGMIVFGLGIHFHGVNHYSFWIDHWAVYPLIIGIAFIVRYTKTKNGLLPGLILVGLAIIMLFSLKVPDSFNWIYRLVGTIETYWPIALIGIGVFFLTKKK